MLCRARSKFSAVQLCAGVSRGGGLGTGRGQSHYLSCGRDMIFVIGIIQQRGQLSLSLYGPMDHYNDTGHCNICQHGLLAVNELLTLMNTCKGLI